MRRLADMLSSRAGLAAVFQEVTARVINMWYAAGIRMWPLWENS